MQLDSKISERGLQNILYETDRTRGGTSHVDNEALRYINGSFTDQVGIELKVASLRALEAILKGLGAARNGALCLYYISSKYFHRKTRFLMP